ncbi:MAG: phosphoribosylamine---glycine ligase [Frankiaceae bacterium]|nr:phosphoribosylamine---glycine ligase [Frankiaceae bacterium]
MRVLVIGSGAREHALCLALSRDPGVRHIVCAPGNAGTARLAETRSVDPLDPTAVADLADAVDADLVVIGPEAPLVNGAADAVRARGRNAFGPSAAAAAIEGSKAFAKDVMTAAGVPTAGFRRCTTTAEVNAALDEFGPPYVVKHDGLAAGKGVVVTADRAAATKHAEGETVVVEEYLDGPEVSLFGITDGTTVLPMTPAQDFKRVGDGDTGPNTGGMGAYSPLPWAPDDLVETITKTVLQPTVDEMARRGTPFQGLLYAGLALTRNGLKVVEFNARFGDPETQVVLARLRTPLGAVLHAAATGGLEDVTLDWSDDAAVTVVMAALGYPGRPTTGQPIDGLAEAGRVADVLHAGTRLEDGKVLTNGGRVLSVTATGPTREAAREKAYEAVAMIRFPGAHWRTDIAG